jgi:GNAT superfamily N-acetyltransferase
VDADPLAGVRALVHAVPLGAARELEPRRWSLDLGIYPAGHDAPVGAMSMIAGDFARMRSAETGSWLLPEWRGQGLGREAREAMLHLLFDGLGAREARSTAHPDNAPSNAVSRALGYAPTARSHAGGRRGAGDRNPPPPHARALAPADRRRAGGVGGVQAAVRAR